MNDEVQSYIPLKKTFEEDLKNFMFLFITETKPELSAIIGVRAYTHEQAFENAKTKGQNIQTQLVSYGLNPTQAFQVYSYYSYEKIKDIFKEINTAEIKVEPEPISKSEDPPKKMPFETFIAGLTMACEEWVRNEQTKTTLRSIIEEIKNQ